MSIDANGRGLKDFAQLSVSNGSSVTVLRVERNELSKFDQLARFPNLLEVTCVKQENLCNRDVQLHAAYNKISSLVPEVAGGENCTISNLTSLIQPVWWHRFACWC